MPKKKPEQEDVPAVSASADTASIEEPAREQPPQAEKVPTPTIEDPTLSSDNRFSTYVDNNAAFPPDAGNQVLEIPGRPTD